jgi:hypothetical protein
MTLILKVFLSKGACHKLRLLDAGFSLRRLGFNPTCHRVRSVVDEITLEMCFLTIFSRSSFNKVKNLQLEPCMKSGI